MNTRRAKPDSVRSAFWGRGIQQAGVRLQYGPAPQWVGQAHGADELATFLRNHADGIASNPLRGTSSVIATPSISEHGCAGAAACSGRWAHFPDIISRGLSVWSALILTGAGLGFEWSWFRRERMEAIHNEQCLRCW
jgi:hypothetical protein